MEKHVGVKGAALALGVHPQTIRGWTRRGILVGIRLPGSRYRRYALEEIQRVRLQMHENPETRRDTLSFDDPLCELDGVGESGCADTVERLHEELASAISRHGAHQGNERARPPRARRTATRRG